MNKIKCENGFQLLLRLQERPNLKTFCPDIFGGNLEEKDVIEITGQAGSGKTELVMSVIINAILPKDLGGLDSSVFLIDTDRNFDLLRLVSLLEAKFQQNSDFVNRKMISEKQDVKQLINLLLEKLIIVQPIDSSQVILTLNYLNDYLVSRLDVRFLIVDSISNFYWIDRMMVGDNVGLLRSRQQIQADLLQKLVQQFNLVLIATRQVLFGTKNGEKDDNKGDQMGDPLGWNWHKLITTFVSVSQQNSFDPVSNSKKFNVQLQKNSVRVNTNFYVTDSGLIFN